MSFASEVKKECSERELTGSEGRAELSAMIQLTSSLTLSSEGMALLITAENTMIAKTILRLIKERYDAETILFVKRKMNLKKNLVYGIRVVSDVKEILTDLGLYSSRGLLDKPLRKIVQSDNNARAYLTGAFMAAGSVNPPETANYHLEIIAASKAHAEFLAELTDRFGIPAKITERRGKQVVYVKAAEKIADFLRIIGAYDALMRFEDERITRDFNNAVRRLANVDLANEMKTQAAAKNQMDDILYLEESGKLQKLDQKLQDVAQLRKQFPEWSLKELADEYAKRTGTVVSKSGMKHRFVRIHEAAEKGRKNEK